jgi:(p)ppGpp synthase/HD superfamily hydrolase
MFEEKIAMTGRTIIDFCKTENTFIFEVEDHYRNVFRCRITLGEEYDMQKNGVYLSEITDDFEEESIIKAEKINVQLRNGKIISMPKGSTVIDVAFAIHEEIGFTVKSAIVNGHKATIYNTLLDGDKVIIEADTCREDGVTQKFIPHVRISWLNSVVTKRAKKKIIEFLSDKYEGDDPKNESKAQTEVVETIADKILEELRSKT